MQDYISLAGKNGVELKGTGSCQFCGADTQRGIHECVEIFNLGFECLDYSKIENHIYRFIAVDAHTLQHAEIHGRWNNHFHLTRQHLMFKYELAWNYGLSPKLSDHLNLYKKKRETEFLKPPLVLKRGNITTTDIRDQAADEQECKELVLNWGKLVYDKWSMHHDVVDSIARVFLQKLPKQD